MLPSVVPLTCLCAVFLSFLSFTQANYGRKSVSTSFGIVRGETVSPEVDDLPAVTQYLGVPYGVAPAGQYRFNMAISAAKWTHQAKDAFSLGNACIQSGLPPLSETEALKTMSAQRFDHVHRILPFLQPQSEDCLYMNLFVPERLTRDSSSSSNSQLSVIVLVHGGDYGYGSGNAYNATVLAAAGQIVVVTLNYRIGVYGFLGRCELHSCSGNAGLSDLVAALKMLSNVLPAFGGDPTSITLMGWGTGASLVSLLMASPITQPKNRLFRRAILLDGSALAPWAMSTHPQQYFMKIAEALKCYESDKRSSKERSTNDVFQNEMSQIIRCVQDHSEKNLTQAAKKLHAPTFLEAFAPIVDGQIVPNHPRISFSPKYGALFRDVDLLVGTVNAPAHHLMANADLERGIDKERRDKILRTLVRNLYDYHRKEILEAVTAEYTDWENPKQSPKALRNGLLNALSDVLFTAPLVETLRMHSTDEVPKVSNTFFFVFGHETRAFSKEQPGNGIRGSLSEDHVPYIMGYPLSAQSGDAQLYTGGFNNDDKNIARIMMHYVSNFVKSGDPSKPTPMSTQTSIEDRFHSTPWPQFSQASREAFLEITDRPRVKNYYRNNFVGFWSSFIPQLNKGSRDGSVPEEHNYLPDHFNRQSFYGYVRPYSALHNDPFPPPPLPPTPIPKDANRALTTAAPKPSVKPTLDAKELAEIELRIATIQGEKNVSMIVLTVIIGIGLLILNIFVSLAFLRMCKNNRGEKKTPKYQSYAATGHLPSADLNYIPNSPLSQQEPLLTSKSSTPAMMRPPGISPTCPRHGRAAQMMIAQGRANSVAMGAGNMGPTLEEVQV
uniref:COesterase domain-containing protein n=1 Tax=Panagrellus redivivus TaxID=6233 RepID=A0A7E4V8S3_PANRE